MNNPDSRPDTPDPDSGPGAELFAKIRDMGGARHLVDGAAPILGYVIGFALHGILTGIAVAVAVALLVGIVRLRHGDRARVVAVSTALVLVFSAMAAVTGEGRNFFLPPLILYAALSVAFGLSLLTATPLTLPICRRIRFEPAAAADPAARVRLHRRVTAAWLVFCVAHVLVMGPVWLAGNVVLLGTLALILNKPMLLAALAGTWVWVRRDKTTTAVRNVRIIVSPKKVQRNSM
ncbi:DUF3159 domain-containing protein [Nocardia sp. SYP-A9097]|uniref:DUF3159 domain-containing protein n=1 Tax=Nocardia sp. SYP-A9097 TaxID=2663237 RepID=UPI00129B103E|nr:DUF3159 domain-containing protein [Nocardia sp. SYP-A9097]MRH89925.1 DUF3159 domain-containing protein [Nocardia sp. SYP-A9097]